MARSTSTSTTAGSAPASGSRASPTSARPSARTGSPCRPTACSRPTDIGLTDDGLTVDTTAGIDFGPAALRRRPHRRERRRRRVDQRSRAGHRPHAVRPAQRPGQRRLRRDRPGLGRVRRRRRHAAHARSGITIAGGVQAGLQESGGNSQTTFGLEGSVSEPGVGTIGGSVGYQSHRRRTASPSPPSTAEAHASGFGVSASAGESYVGTSTRPHGSVSQWHHRSWASTARADSTRSTTSATPLARRRRIPSSGTPADGAATPVEAAAMSGAPTRGRGANGDVAR